ncbi:winged helix-turn-helix transcriptional regulator [Acidovorax cavernicola]|uniref:Transcriptional regulator n=1 Tax=Acidovorax cavernicola TaxID=1675792 RepID=A0A9X8CYY5_9BURK|nr:helix-turn-helix domain-containing protein [Acidovorax cavernicola]RIX73360.1 transcriptional regulator [Acidovorax cavernicola]
MASSVGTSHALPELDVPARVLPVDCPVEDWLQFLGHRWNALLLWHLNVGELRHGELMAALPGVTAKVLSERLTQMERRGLVVRRTSAGFPRVVSYGLTAQARALVPVLDALELWAKQPDRA